MSGRFTWLLTGVIWGAFLALAIESCARGAEYEIVVRSVYDGDTITADIALPPERVDAMGKRIAVAVTFLGERIRLAGINAPEQRTAEGKRCRGELAAMLPPGTRGTLRTSGRELEKYGRAFGRVIVGGEDIGERMVRAGLARPWDGKGERP